MKLFTVNSGSVNADVQLEDTALILTIKRRNGHIVDSPTIYVELIEPMNEEHAYKMACLLLKTAKDVMRMEVHACMHEYRESRQHRRKIRNVVFSQPSSN